MNMFFKFPLCMTVVTIMATSMISCSDNNKIKTTRKQILLTTT